MDVLIFYIFLFTTAESKRLVGHLQRIENLQVNKKYVETVRMVVKRADRNSEYTASGYVVTKHSWGDNVTVTLDLFEQLHNEYRPSFIQFDRRLCAFIDDPLIGIKFLMKIPCPFPIGNHTFVNVPFSIPNFDYTLPFQRGRVDLIFKITKTLEMIGIIRTYVSMEITPEPKRKWDPRFQYLYSPVNT